jgi:hypothetical protein
MMGGMEKSQPTPRQPDPVRIPSADDPELLLARRKKLQQQMTGNSGRESTQLGASADPSYSRATLG